MCSHRRDLFDNEVAFCFYPEKGTELKSTLVLELELRERNPFHFLLESHALDFPFQYKPRGDLYVLSPYLKDAIAERLTHRSLSGSRRRSRSFPPSWNSNESIRENIKYERRDEGAARDPAERLRWAWDRAAITHGCSRTPCARTAWRRAWPADISASSTRRRSGRRARFTHGSRLICPGRDGCGMDPTNGTLANHVNHITAAVGLSCLPGYRAAMGLLFLQGNTSSL